MIDFGMRHSTKMKAFTIAARITLSEVDDEGDLKSLEATALKILSERKQRI